MNIFTSDDVAVSTAVLSRDRVETLSNRPNMDVAYGGGGMTATELKAHFDKIGLYVATKLRNLLEGLQGINAGSSIGIENFDGDDRTSIKGMFDELSSETGATRIGTGKIIDGDNANLQDVIDDIYSLIDGYSLDDMAYIRTGLDYNSTTGELDKITDIEGDISTIDSLFDNLSSILTLNASGTSSLRLDNIEGDIDDIVGCTGMSYGIATLDGNGKLAQPVDASKITSGTLPLSVIPDCAFERTFNVDSTDDMYALTYDDVQNGDIVIVDDDRWFKVVDDQNLNVSGGYKELAGGRTAVAVMAEQYDSTYDGSNSIAVALSNATTANSQTATDLATLQTTVAGITTSVTSAVADVSGLSTRLSTAETTITNHDGGLMYFGTTISELDENVEELYDITDDLDDAISDVEDRLDNCEVAVTAITISDTDIVTTDLSYALITGLDVAVGDFISLRPQVNSSENIYRAFASANLIAEVKAVGELTVYILGTTPTITLPLNMYRTKAV